MNVKRGDASLELRVTGDSTAPTLMFLHHFGGSSRTWDGVIRRLEGRFQCVALDQRGFGDSSAAGDYSLKAMAEDVLAVVDALSLERYVLIGHSMGGKVALSVASHRPAGLEGLVLIAPSPPTPEPMRADERTRLLRSHGSREAAIATNRSISRLPIEPAAFEALLEDNLRCKGAAWTAWLESGSLETVELGVIDLPTLLIAGEHDPVIPLELLTREVAPHLTEYRLEVIAGAGHLLPLEAAGRVAALIGGAAWSK